MWVLWRRSIIQVPESCLIGDIAVVTIRNRLLGNPCTRHLGQAFKGIVGEGLCRRAHTRAQQQVGRTALEVIGHAVQSTVVVPF